MVSSFNTQNPSHGIDVMKTDFWFCSRCIAKQLGHLRDPPQTYGDTPAFRNPVVFRPWVEPGSDDAVNSVNKGKRKGNDDDNDEADEDDADFAPTPTPGARKRATLMSRKKATPRSRKQTTARSASASKASTGKAQAQARRAATMSTIPATSSSAYTSPYALTSHDANISTTTPAAQTTARGWLPHEELALIEAMTSIVANGLNGTEQRWVLASEELKRKGFTRSPIGCKMAWMHGLRERSGVDERVAAKNKTVLSTGLQGKKGKRARDGD